MQCIKCGTQLPIDALFCPKCGSAINSNDSSNAIDPLTYRGYSQKLESPEMKKYLAMQRRWRNIALAVVVVAPIIGFCIYAHVSNSITMSEALTYGPIVSLIMFIFGIFPTVKQKMQKSYIGTVTDLRYKTKTSTDDDGITSTTTTYYIVTRDQHGKKHTHKSTGYGAAYSYLKIGDEIRYLPQFPIPFEKRLSSADTHVCCVFCGSEVSLDTDTCPRCKAPILN